MYNGINTMNSPINLSETLQLTLPLFQAPLECYPGQADLVAAVSSHGALGIYSANYQALSAIENNINDIRLQTDKAFAVLVDVNGGNSDIDLTDRSVANAYLSKAYETLGIDAGDAPPAIDVEVTLRHLIELRPPAIIFQNGLPNDTLINACKDADILTMAIVSTPLEAIVADRLVDALILQGNEAAGVHSGFPNDLHEKPYPCNTLLHHALQNVSKPLVVWGDYQFPQNVVAALINGTSAVMIDTLFWTTTESPIPDAYRQALHKHNEAQVTISRVWLGHPAQTLKNSLTQSTHHVTPLSPRQQQRIMLPIISAAIAQNNADYMPMWAGLCALSTDKSVAEVCEKFLQELNNIIR